VALGVDDLSVAINVSARNLQDRHFPARVFEVLAEHRLSPHRLELEITESAFMSDQDRSRITLDELREAGVRVAVDDFGTGYSSFASLRELDVDRLKIDRSFIAGLLQSDKDQILVRSIISMAGELGLETVAEGIEDLATWDLVRSFGCTVGQGYLLSHPLTFRQLAGWFARRSLLVDLSEFEMHTFAGAGTDT
jgi:EAL domain-containing protein (putative c-di-GMP-specific phosphodiesterase class I)